MPASRLARSAAATSYSRRDSRIDLARELGKRLAIPRVRFVNEALFSTLLVAGRKDWDLAIAQISVTPARAQRVDFSSPYLSADQACSSASD